LLAKSFTVRLIAQKWRLIMAHKELATLDFRVGPVARAAWLLEDTPAHACSRHVVRVLCQVRPFEQLLVLSILPERLQELVPLVPEGLRI
jgi:hypothetical protein